MRVRDKGSEKINLILRCYVTMILIIGILPISPLTRTIAADNQVHGLPGITRIWAIDDGVKILRDDLNHPSANSYRNLVWDGEKVSLFGARNEVVAFQIMLESNAQGANAINVEISDLTNGAAIIPGSAASPADPFDYRGKHIELFTAHYINIPEPSVGGSAWADLGKPEQNYIGWVPDALIPFVAPVGLGGAPFDIPASQNQSVWVDIWIPRTAEGGLYSGIVHLSAGEDATLSLPLEIMVYDFLLPDETHLMNMFGFSQAHLSRRYGLQAETAEFYALETKFHQMAHRHRMDLVRPVHTIGHMRSFHKKYLTGELYTESYNYDGPGYAVGNNTFSIGLYGSVPAAYGGSWETTSKEHWWTGSDIWANWFLENAPHVSIHKFLFPDEPDSNADRDMIRIQAEWSHSNPGVGATIPTFVTIHVNDEYLDYVDFWSTSAHFAHPGISPGTNPQQLQNELDQGKIWGFYNGYRPMSGCQVIDADAIEFRINPWIAWKYDVDQYFYWMTTNWFNSIAEGQTVNVFSNPYTMTRPRMGAGTFFYPGIDRLLVEENRGLDGPLSSIRMKNWRRGAQDYEYLWLADSLGLQEDVERIVNTVVPHALWESNINANISWPADGYGFDIYREELAQLIADKYIEPEPTPAPPSTPVPVNTATMTAEPTSVPNPKLDPSAANTLSLSYKPQYTLNDIAGRTPFAQEIETLYLLGYLDACRTDPTEFCPKTEITRAEMAIMLTRVLHGPDFVPPETTSFHFEDVNKTTWGAYWIEQFFQEGFTFLYFNDQTTFAANAPVSRIEAAIYFLLLKHGQSFSPLSGTNLLLDISDMHSYVDWANAAHQQGIIPACAGADEPLFCPEQALTRAEAAYSLKMILDSP